MATRITSRHALNGTFSMQLFLTDLMCFPSHISDFFIRERKMSVDDWRSNIPWQITKTAPKQEHYQAWALSRQYASTKGSSPDQRLAGWMPEIDLRDPCEGALPTLRSLDWTGRIPTELTIIMSIAFQRSFFTFVVFT
jgi:hypothetical protein